MPRIVKVEKYVVIQIKITQHLHSEPHIFFTWAALVIQSSSSAIQASQIDGSPHPDPSTHTDPSISVINKMMGLFQ